MTVSSFDSRENNFTPLGHTSFRLHGSKIIGTDAYAQPVYKYDRNLFTDGSGNVSLTEMEWDVYLVVMPETPVNDISGTLPLLPLNLSPGGNQDFDFSVSPHTDHSFFITIKDNSQNLIASASARVYDDLGFAQEKTTGDLENPDGGQVLFPGLTEQIYHLTATASGFQNYANDFSISGYTKADVVLIPE